MNPEIQHILNLNQPIKKILDKTENYSDTYMKTMCVTVVETNRA